MSNFISYGQQIDNLFLEIDESFNEIFQEELKTLELYQQKVNENSSLRKKENFSLSKYADSLPKLVSKIDKFLTPFLSTALYAELSSFQHIDKRFLSTFADNDSPAVRLYIQKKKLDDGQCTFASAIRSPEYAHLNIPEVFIAQKWECFECGEANNMLKHTRKTPKNVLSVPCKRCGYVVGDTDKPIDERGLPSISPEELDAKIALFLSKVRVISFKFQELSAVDGLLWRNDISDELGRAALQHISTEGIKLLLGCFDDSGESVYSSTQVFSPAERMEIEKLLTLGVFAVHQSKKNVHTLLERYSSAFLFEATALLADPEFTAGGKRRVKHMFFIFSDYINGRRADKKHMSAVLSDENRLVLEVLGCDRRLLKLDRLHMSALCINAFFATAPFREYARARLKLEDAQ